jgi:hypothetical protein
MDFLGMMDGVYEADICRLLCKRKQQQALINFMLYIDRYKEYRTDYDS